MVREWRDRLMEGLFFKAAGYSSPDEKIKDVALLAKNGDTEIVTQTIKMGSAAWLSTSDDDESFEFFYLLSGKLGIVSNETEIIPVEPGDSFITTQLRESVLLKCIEEAQILHVTNKPGCDSAVRWQDNQPEQKHGTGDKGTV